MSARWKSLKVPKKVLCVILFLKNFQNHSMGFNSGEYGGKNKSLRRSSCASKNDFSAFEWCTRALSNPIMSFWDLGYLQRRPSKKCWNWSVFNDSENATCTFPLFGSTAPMICCLFRPPYVKTSGWNPFRDHIRVIVGENWTLVSSKKRITSSGSRASSFF